MVGVKWCLLLLWVFLVYYISKGILFYILVIIGLELFYVYKVILVFCKRWVCGDINFWLRIKKVEYVW